MSNQNTVTPGLAIFERLAPLGYPLIRITAGLMLMPHGAQKLFGWFGGYGLEATGQFFEGSLGMSPGILFALLAGLVEFFGGLALVLGLTAWLGRRLGFNVEDRITIIFAGSKKSLATGVPMAQVLFAGGALGTLILPLMLFHQIQLMVCAVLAERYGRRAETGAEEAA